MTRSPEKRLRVFELLLVLWVAFAASVLTSLFAAAGTALPPPDPGSDLRVCLGLANQIGPLALLAYVLFRQGRGLADLGLRLSWKALPLSAAVFGAGWSVSYVWTWGLWYGYHWATGGRLSLGAHNVGFLSGQDRGWGLPLLLAYAFLNPFKEELIARAFLQSEVRALSGRVWLGVVLSVAFQASYHLYQGIWAAASHLALFLLFALYYARTRDLLPVILAHLYFDLYALARAH